MLKKLIGGGVRNCRVPLAAGALCLLLVIASGCKKAASTTNHRSQSPGAFGTDTKAAAAMEKDFTADAKALRAQQIDQLKKFSAMKEKQAEKLAIASSEKITAEARRFFDAGKSGEVAAIQKMFRDFARRHRQYANSSNDKSLDTSYWSTLLEVDLGYQTVAATEPKSLQFFVDDTIDSIPPGSIYFGGTDTGRGLITAFMKSHADGDPFFTLTQNALADPTYLAYLRSMFGARIYIPSADDSSKCFSDYMTDAQKRLTHDQDHPGEPRQVKPGENITMKDGHVSISGQVAVMEINGLLVKNFFDHNPDREFYVEESFPLDWMYPYLEPHGVIMKLDREKLETMSESILAQDREYWHKRVSGMIGDWLAEDTSVRTVADFVEKTCVQKDLRGFTGDKGFIESKDAQKVFSKLRSSIGGIYDWRRKNAASGTEKDRMTREAELAYREAFALCPDSPEAVFRYVQLLIDTRRYDDAALVASTSLKVSPNNQQVVGLLKQVNGLAGK